MTEPLDATDGAGPLDRLHRLVDFQVGFFRAHPAFARLYLRFTGTADAAHGVTVDPSVQLRFERGHAHAGRAVHRGPAGGRVP